MKERQEDRNNQVKALKGSKRARPVKPNSKKPKDGK